MTSLLAPGTKVAICGLKGAGVKRMNGVEGIVNKYIVKKERYVVEFPEGPMKVKRSNIVALSESKQQQPQAKQVFSNEDEMIEKLKAMGMPPEMLESLTPEQKRAMMLMTMKKEVIEAAKNTPGVMADQAELKEAAGGLYSWKDAKDHMYMEMKGATPATTCTIGVNSLVVTGAGGEMLLEGELFQEVNCSESGYEVRDEKLLVTLVKKKPMRWLMLLR
jgi:hypothetical protein